MSNPNPKLNQGPFRVMFNEQQRQVLVKVMRHALKDSRLCIEMHNIKCMGGAFPTTQLEELKLLVDLTEQLPGSEPDVLNGFCL